MTVRIKMRPVMFVSHSGSDEFLAALQRYCDDVEVLVSGWRDQSGESLADKVKSDVGRSDLVVVVLSPAAQASAWVHQEIGLAVGLGKIVIPVVPSGSDGRLPGLIQGLDYISLPPERLEETALRVATRVSRQLERDLVRHFDTFQEYCDWWATIREDDYTDDVCLWAAPHDLWSWFREPGTKRGVHYRTLIRGDLPFDHETVRIHFGGSEVVVGVQELPALQETHVFGNLTVDTFYEPDFREKVERELSQRPDGIGLHEWYKQHAKASTRIEVQLSMDPVRAAGHRRRLDRLFERYAQSKEPRRESV